MYMKYPSLETAPFTIYIQLWKDEGEEDFYYIAICPELNLNITADSEKEAVEDMKEIVKDIISNKSEQELLGYGIKMMDNVDIDRLVFDVKASGYNQILA